MADDVRNECGENLAKVECKKVCQSVLGQIGRSLSVRKGMLYILVFFFCKYDNGKKASILVCGELV